MNKRKTTEEFIEQAKVVHKNRYKYDKVSYKTAKDKVTITCTIHGDYQQTPDSHLSGQGCPICGGSVKHNTQYFIKLAKELHKEKYNYSLVEYINSKTKIKIICPIHGVFEQIPSFHLSGGGCCECAKNIKLTQEDFVNRANIVHNNKYDYSKVKYISSFKKVDILCMKHGVFKQRPHNHLSGNGCPLCAREKIDTETFVKKAKSIHKNRYDYSKVNYINSKTPVEIICFNHGVFQQTPEIHLGGSGCKFCKSSLGEIIVEEILIILGLKYIREYKFKDCKYKKPLPFDFAIFDKEGTFLKMLIEFDGQHHYHPVRYGGITKEQAIEIYEGTRIRDKIKTEYCKKNEIPLLRIYNKNKELIQKEIEEQLALREKNIDKNT